MCMCGRQREMRGEREGMCVARVWCWMPGSVGELYACLTPCVGEVALSQLFSQAHYPSLLQPSGRDPCIYSITCSEFSHTSATPPGSHIAYMLHLQSYDYIVYCIVCML